MNSFRFHNPNRDQATCCKRHGALLIECCPRCKIVSPPYVFSMFNYYAGNLPGIMWDTISELLKSAVIAGVVFCVFIAANVVITNLHRANSQL